MKTITVICEGPTEVEFCKTNLNGYLGYGKYTIMPKNIDGNCNWERIKYFVEKSLKSQPNAIVTTMIDYYGLKGNTFPKWQESLEIMDKRERIVFLENEMHRDIESSLQNRFIPYLQLHEFEALLFNNYGVFDQIFNDEECNKIKLQEVFSTFPDPEMINDTRENSPSHRLSDIIPTYNKIVYGNLLVESIGVINIYNKNQHFKEWIDKIR